MTSYKVETSLEKPAPGIQAITQRAQGLPQRAALLIKGQTLDLNERKPHKIKQKLPSFRHRIVFVWCEPEQVKARLEKEPREAPINSEVELRIQLGKVKKLMGEFEVVCINATNTNYNLVDWPGA